MTQKTIGITTRGKRFAKAASYYWGTVYDELPEHHSIEAEDLRLRESAPSVQVRWTKKTVDTVVGYLFGESQKPRFYVDRLYDDEGNAIEGQEQEIEDYNAKIEKIRQWSGLDKYLGELARLGCLQGSVGLAGHTYESLIWCEVLRLADVRARFARDDRKLALENDLQEDDLIELTEHWVTSDEDENGEIFYELHRRQWTLEETIEYLPARVEPDDIDLAQAMTQDPEKSVKHGLGFIPVVWIKPAIIANDIDGAPLVSKADFDQEDEANYTLTQLGRAVRYAAEPQLYAIDADLSPETPLKRGANQGIVLHGTSAAKGPPSIGLLEMTGDGVDRGIAYVSLLKRQFEESTRVIQHDPEKALGALSGTAIERLMQPLIMLISTLRENYGRALARWFELMLRVEEVEGVTVSVDWPPIVPPTPEDLSLYAPTIVQLYTSNVITHETAIELLSHMIGINDAAEYIAAFTEQEAAASGGGSSSTAGLITT